MLKDFSLNRPLQQRNGGLTSKITEIEKKNIPRTQMTLVLFGKGLVLKGLTFKNRGHWGSRYRYI